MTALRVHVATDGSPSAQTALDLVRSLALPSGSTVRVVQVVSPLPALVEFGPTPNALAAIDEATTRWLGETATAQRREGVTVEWELLRGGTVAGAIVDDARRLRADLLVTGSRGHGPIGTALLGSVGAAVTDHAPCPVLVARRPACRRLVFAEDGSPSAFEARRLVATWPIFRGLQVRVTSVAHVTAPLLSGIAPTMVQEARRAHAELLAETRSAYERLALESAEQLRVAGLLAQGEVRTGDPAAEILAAARDAEADLVVVGSRGHGGMTRLLLGSVARNVLLHASCSVMVVRRTVE